jgi:hypothetical protein
LFLLLLKILPLCGTLGFFEQLCVIAITQRATKITLSSTKKKMKIMSENELSKKIIGCAIEVHKQAGTGLLESAYQVCLYYEIMQL